MWIKLGFWGFSRLIGLVSNLNITKIATVELAWLSWVSVGFVVGYNLGFGVFSRLIGLVSNLNITKITTA